MRRATRIDASRRDALARAWAGGVGATLACLVHVGARADPVKLSKSAVQYVDGGRVAGKDCDDCTQFIAGASRAASGSCKLVEGAIDPHGHCIAFTPRPRVKAR